MHKFPACAMIASAVVIGGCGSQTIASDKMVAQPSTKTPIKVFSIKVRASDQNRFLASLERFAQEHGFAFRLVRYDKTSKNIRAELWRSDIHGALVNPMKDDEFIVSLHRGDYDPGSEALESSAENVKNGILALTGVAGEATAR